jgi:ATP synthase protein I
MNDLEQLLRNVFRFALFFLSACFLFWAIFPQWRPYAAGLVLGTLVSLINARILTHKIHVITQAVLQNSGARVNMGFVGRICVVLIGTMIAVKLPQFHLVATIAGFFFVQLATLVMGFVFIFQNRIRHEKR